MIGSRDLQPGDLFYRLTIGGDEQEYRVVQNGPKRLTLVRTTGPAAGEKTYSFHSTLDHTSRLYWRAERRR